MFVEMTVESAIQRFIIEYDRRIDTEIENRLNAARQDGQQGKTIEAIKGFFECANRVRANIAQLELIQTLYLNGEIFGFLDEEIELNRKKESDILIENADRLLKAPGIDRSEVAWGCIHASLVLYERLKSISVEERLVYQSQPGHVFCETESPFYKVKYFLRAALSIFDEISAELTAKNDFNNAFQYLSILGEIFLHEIVVASNVNDDCLYSKEDIGELFFNAGEAFLRAHTIMKDKYLTTTWIRPLLRPYTWDTADILFHAGRHYLSNEELAILCFGQARDILYQTRSRNRYLMAKEKLSKLKKEMEDFEFVLANAFINISRELCTHGATCFKYLGERTKLKEGSIRDYYLSHLRLLVQWISVSEEPRLLGRSDLTVFRRDDSGIKCLVAEFKVWGRQSYLDVIKQLKGYLTDFERFGIIIMVNLNKNSVKEKYIESVIRKDGLYRPESIKEEQVSDTNFVFLESEHFTDATKNQKIRIYHLILNLNQTLT